MKRLLPFVLAALMIPSAALAKGPNPNHPNKGTHPNKGKAKVMYVLKGTLSAYTAYDSASNTAGSITIDISRANHHGKALVGQSLTFPVGLNTRVVLSNGISTITDGDQGIVKVRDQKAWGMSSSDLITMLEQDSARQIIDPANVPNPAADSNPSKGTVMYVLKGTLSGYSNYDSSTSTDGSITIDVSRANRHGKALVGQSLTFPMVDSSTRVVLGNGASLITDGDRGIVKLRAPKAWNLNSSDLTTLLEGYPVFQIIDQHPSSS